MAKYEESKECFLVQLQQSVSQFCSRILRLKRDNYQHGRADQCRLSPPPAAVHEMSFIVEDNWLLTSNKREKQTYKAQKEASNNTTFPSHRISVQSLVVVVILFASSGILFRREERLLSGHTGERPSVGLFNVSRGAGDVSKIWSACRQREIQYRKRRIN